VVVGVLFVLWEQGMEARGGEPIFEFSLLRYRSFGFGLLTIFIVALGEFGTFLALSIYLQLAKGLGAFETGLQYLAFAIVTVIAAPLAGMLSTRFGAKWIVTAGMVCEGVALFWISQILYIDQPTSSLIPPLMLYGLGIGLAIAQLSNLVLSDIPANKAGQASGATNTVRQLGASLGIAIIGAVLFGTFADAATPLVRNSTAFTDFGTRVAANTTIAPASKLIGQSMAGYSGQAKDAIIAGLQANEGFDNINPLDNALAHVPAQGRTALKMQGIDLDNPATIAQIRKDLNPDVVILMADIQNALATGFSTAGRAAGLLSALFVLFGAFSSLMLPNTKAHHGEDVVVALAD